MWSWPDCGTQLDSFRRRQHSASWFSRGHGTAAPPVTVFVARQRGYRPSDDVIDTSDIDVHLGLDVDKGEHHSTALTP